MKIISCNSNRPLAEAISAYVNLPLTKATVRRFSDMEIFVEINENVRGEDVFVMQMRSGVVLLGALLLSSLILDTPAKIENQDHEHQFLLN